MSETRFKNYTFKLDNDQGRCASWANAQLAALYDIRDELQKLNSLLHYSNFTTIPKTLKEIRYNTRKKKRKSKAVS